MPQRIEVPGHGTVEFPDGMTDEQIVAAIKSNPAPTKGAFEGVGSALRQGLADATSGVGETLKQTDIAPAIGEAMKRGAAVVAPEEAPQTSLYTTEGGLQPQNAVRFAASQSPTLAATLAAAKLGARVPGGPLAKTLGGLLGAASVIGATNFGNNAKEAAVNRTEGTNAEPSYDDKLRAAGTTALEAGIGAVGGSRFLPGVGKVTATGTKGILQAAKQLALRSGAEGAAGAGQVVAHDVGMGAGTDNGVTIDPAQVINAGLGSAATAGMLSTPRGAADAIGAVHDRHFGGDNTNATAAVANRIQRIATDSGTNLKYAAPTVGARDEIVNELKQEISGLGRTFEPDVANALERAKSGQASEQDISSIKAATADNPASARLIDLTRQSSMIHDLLGRGIIANGKFKGGAAAAIGNHLNNYAIKAAGLGGAAALGANLPTAGIYAPHTAAAIGGGWLALRALDRLTGMRTPAKTFVNKFADPNVAVRPDVPVPTPAPIDRGPITGPNIPPQPPSPWGYEQPAPDTKQIIARMSALVNARKVAAKNTVAEAIPALRQLASTAQPQGNTQDPQQLKAQMDALVNTRGAVAQQNVAQALPELRRLAAGAQPAPAPTPDNVIPKDVLTNARALMRGRAMVDKLQASSQVPQPAPAPVPDTAASDVKLPKSVATNSRTLVRGLVSMAKIKATNDKAAAKTQAQATKVAVQAAKAQAKAAAQVAAQAEPVVTKIKKANGKVKQAAAAPQPQPAAEAPAFTPKSDSELPMQGMDHAEAADAYFSAKGTKPSDQERAAKIRGRSMDEAMIANIASRATAAQDKGTLYSVLEELHHSSSRSYTMRMRDYFAAKLPKALGDELKATLNDGWIARNKHRP